DSQEFLLAPGTIRAFGIRLHEPRLYDTAGTGRIWCESDHQERRMRKLIGVAAIVFLISALAMAGEAPAPEIYGGYQFTSTDGGWHGQGFNAGGNLYITHWLAGTADFGSGFSSGSKLYSYTFGPTVAAQRKNFTPFAHALFGGAHASAGSVGTSGMAMMFG